jgi:hypothetical protein
MPPSPRYREPENLIRYLSSASSDTVHEQSSSVRTALLEKGQAHAKVLRIIANTHRYLIVNYSVEM